MWFFNGKDYIRSPPICISPIQIMSFELHFKTVCLYCKFACWYPKQHFKRRFKTFHQRQITKPEIILFCIQNVKYWPEICFCIFIFVFKVSFFAKTLLCVPKLGFQVLNLIVKFNTGFLVFKNRHSLKMPLYVSTSKSNTVFWYQRWLLYFATVFVYYRFKNTSYSKNEIFIWNQYLNYG